MILKAKERRYILLSTTGSGRHLTIVVAFKFKGRVRLITARDMTTKEKQYYKRRGK